MGKRTLDDLLSQARNELHDENIVTLLGEPEAGKTVVSALLKHALFDKFIPLHGGRYDALVEKRGAINDILRGMKVDGDFPPATIRADSPRATLKMYKMTGPSAGENTLIIQDSSGENYMSFLDEDLDPEKRLEAILTFDNENEGVGPLAPYIFSKVYLLAIECPDNDSEWDLRYPSAIKALRDVHKTAKLTTNSKFTSHMAILFTKSDKLSADDQNKDASELLNKIPELQSALRLCHGGQCECFKLWVSVENESTQDLARRVKRMRDQAASDFKLARVEYTRKLAEHVAKSAAHAKKEGASKYAGPDLDQYVKEAESKAKQSFSISTPAPRLEFDESKANTIKSKVKKELDYSQDEYVRLLGWILNRLYD